ncbi:MAG: Gfo/Idh/MocA family oxidoreductase [Planctomycetota bacterium]|nr:Gfo/Idh/MocA family oxidoreductase [Planctomycetota bacterium]
MPDLRLCMIGAGQHASKNMYPNFPLLNGARVVANADLDENRAREIAGRYGIAKSYADPRRMLEAEKPDGVLICIGSTLHEKLAPEILGLGYPVYVEKPGCDTLEGARRIAQASERSGKIFMTAYKKRFAPAYVKAKKIVQSPEFGRPSLLTALRTKGPSAERDPSKSGSCYLLQWGCHILDLLPFLFGNVAEVEVFRAGTGPEAIAANLRFANGALGQLAISSAMARSRIREEVMVIGSGGIRVNIDNSTTMLALNGDQPFALHQPDWTNGANFSNIEQGFLGELQEFANAIREKRQPEANARQCLHTMALYDAIVRSWDDGGIVRVEES